MCYYNGQKVTRVEYIRLKQLEKAVANYDFLNKDLQIGFDYSENAVLKKTSDSDFDIVKMEWGFLPSYWKTREEARQFRNGFKDRNLVRPSTRLCAYPSLYPPKRLCYYSLIFSPAFITIPSSGA